ncbi:MAG: hypothetical protein ABI835_09115 [Chloroflexota bacterium]
MRKFAILMVVVLLLSMVASVSADGETSDPLCAGSLPNRLAVGDHGQIAQRFSTLRPAPGAVGTTIYADEGEFEVLDVQCAATGPLWWLHIHYLDSGLDGWASESQVLSIYGFNQYWLESAVVEVESVG